MFVIDVVQCLVGFELIFPPSFFNIMTHLLVHLVKEISSDQYLYITCSHSKGSWGYSRNVFVIELAEGSIASAYGTEEVIDFCVDFIDDLKPIGVPKSRYEGRLNGKDTLGKKSYVCTDDFSFKKAHYAVLQQSSLVDPYIEEYKKILLSEFPGKSEAWITREHMNTFGSWLRKHLMHNLDISEQLFLLARGPS